MWRVRTSWKYRVKTETEDRGLRAHVARDKEGQCVCRTLPGMRPWEGRGTVLAAGHAWRALLGRQRVCSPACIGVLVWRDGRPVRGLKPPSLLEAVSACTKWGAAGWRDTARKWDKRKIGAADLSVPENLQEYFQGLESHMILTETLFRKIISFAVPQETRFHAELMAQASAVLKQAHKRGVELEYILEVRLSTDSLPHSRLCHWGKTRLPMPCTSWNFGTPSDPAVCSACPSCLSVSSWIKALPHLESASFPPYWL